MKVSYKRMGQTLRAIKYDGYYWAVVFTKVGNYYKKVRERDRSRGQKPDLLIWFCPSEDNFPVSVDFAPAFIYGYQECRNYIVVQCRSRARVD